LADPLGQRVTHSSELWTAVIRRTVRTSTRALLGVLVAALWSLVAAGPAFALDNGEVPGQQSLGVSLLYFVVVPFGTCALIALLVALPGLARRPRYRPGRPWDYDPLWFAGPENPDLALARVRAGTTGKGGASAEW
jgi:hypothetical protein